MEKKLYPKPRRVLVDDPPPMPPKPPAGGPWSLCPLCNEWVEPGWVTLYEEGCCPDCAEDADA